MLKGCTCARRVAESFIAGIEKVYRILSQARLVSMAMLRVCVFSSSHSISEHLKLHCKLGSFNSGWGHVHTVVIPCWLSTYCIEMLWMTAE